MKNFRLVLIAIVTLSSAASADVILQPGEVKKVGNEKVYCTGNASGNVKVYSCRCWFSGDYGPVTVTVRDGEDLRTAGKKKCAERVSESYANVMDVKYCRLVD